MAVKVLKEDYNSLRASVKKLYDEYQGRLEANKKMKFGMASKWDDGHTFGKEEAYETIIEDLKNILGIEG